MRIYLCVVQFGRKYLGVLLDSDSVVADMNLVSYKGMVNKYMVSIFKSVVWPSRYTSLCFYLSDLPAKLNLTVYGIVQLETIVS